MAERLAILIIRSLLWPKKIMMRTISSVFYVKKICDIYYSVLSLVSNFLVLIVSSLLCPNRIVIQFSLEIFRALRAKNTFLESGQFQQGINNDNLNFLIHLFVSVAAIGIIWINNCGIPLQMTPVKATFLQGPLLFVIM